MKNLLYLLLVLCLLLPTGCYNLRKKFIRKNAKQEEQSVYVDFKDYPKGDSHEAYADLALFFRSWLSEAIGLLEQDGNRKRVRHSMEEALGNLEDMIDLRDGLDKDKFVQLHQELLKVDEDFSSTKAATDFDRNHIIFNLQNILKKFEAQK